MARFSIIAVSAALLAPFAINAQPVERLPVYLLQLPASAGTIFVAEADTSTLHRFVRDPNGVDLHDERYMSVGQNGIGKRRAWDGRTPLGIYFINDQLDTSGLHERYGPLAFPLDYPNAWDRMKERSGDGIWIHGVTSQGGLRAPQDTEGCIALPNDELLKLENDFVPMITPVIITRQIEWTTHAQITVLRDELGAALDIWAQSYRSGDLHRYLTMYAEDFSHRGLDRNEWSAYRLHTMGAKSIQGFILGEVMLLADPEDQGLFLSRFRQTIVDAGQSIITTKRLYWRRSESGEFRIVAEDNG